MVKSKTEDLEHFITVVDCGSFTSAANLLDTQVAKISRSIARLEKQIDVTLFNRSTRRIELTEEGHVFLTYAKTALDTLNKGEEALNSLKGQPKGKLRVDAVSPFLFHQIVPHIADFQSAYPDIQIDLVANENIVDLIEKKTDVAIRIGQLADSNLYARRLGRSKLHMVASPSYLAENPAPLKLSDLAQHKIIGFSESPKLNNWHLPNTGAMRPNISASNGETIRQLAIAGNGIALLSHFMIQQDLAAGHLIEVLPNRVTSPNPREEVNAVYYKNSAVSSRISAFLDFFSLRLSL